ncbi:hypothetical protein [Diaphorobacter sp.]|uniref:hypothetical protein n=1 Tax=Diaphorobacter sp. TaxID=1934310 RepID=UPI0028AF77EB|nr:hypothetical protein [Diaphorobacter sp.]
MAIIIKKKYINFAELCQRWSINSEDLHYLISEEKVFPAIITSEALTVYVWEEDQRGDDVHYKLEIMIEDQGWVSIKPRYPIYLQSIVRDSAYHYRFFWANSEKRPALPYTKDYPGFDNWFKLNEEITMADVEAFGMFLIEDIEEFESESEVVEEKNDVQVASVEKPLSLKEKNSLYNIIGSMLAFLEYKKIEEAEVKKFVSDHRYTDLQGVSIRNLEKVFPIARKSIGEA